jgi:hypothetical protein
MGVAAQMEHGNAAALPFAPSRSDWKKVDSAGNVARENCLGSDAYADWWFKVQRNTIAKYKLSLWSWDPGPGNAFFCYSNQHGHIPGKGGYKGWRNTTAIMRRLKEEFTGLYYQGFYGRKEYGLWGLKYIDQHEAYWEQQAQYLASIHPDIHSDRMNADGVRLQSWWNQTFRFLPAVMNHALVHRLTQVYADDPKLKRVWDHTGWKYAFMSGLAIGGSITAPILPETLDDVTGYKAFYEKWLRWARKNFEYVKYNLPFGEQVQVGGIDGYARIKGDHGYIFLCNPGPRPARTQFILDDAIGLKARGRFTLKELYPYEDAYYFDETNRRGIYAAGNAVSVVVPAYQVVLLELSPFKEDQLPLLFGARGQLKRAGSTLRISGVEGEQGKAAHLVVATREKENPRTFTVNSLAVRAQHEGQYSSADVRLAGTDLVRMLDDWRTADGNQFSFPIHDAYDDLSLTTMFRADPQIRASLRAAQPPNLPEIQPLINNWLKNGFPDTFTWARPDRLILVVPFADADRVRKVALQFNGAETELRCYELAGGFSGQANKIIFYADLTDAIRWAQENTLTLHVDRMAANQFLGPYLDYPPAPLTAQIKAADLRIERTAVVYDRPLEPETYPKTTAEGIHLPAIVSAWMSPEGVRENQNVTFFATTDLPAKELQGVYLSSVVGPDCWADQELQYNPETKTWSITLKLRERVRMILGCPCSYVWAVAKDGQVSDTWKIPMGWLFSK